jgi:NAD(P)-dependent dehydrogenase (short-subunit alcohol dehydrogenase family)
MLVGDVVLIHALPEEIARSAPYLATDMASFVTAATLMADGGLRG